MQRFEINNHPKLINFINRETGVDLRTIDFNILEKARAVLEACREMKIPITTVSDTLAKRHLFPLDFISDNLSHMMKEVKDNEPQYRELMHDFDVALMQLHFQQRLLLTISRDEFGIPSDCPSSYNLGQVSVFPFGGSGSSLIEFMRVRFDGASAG